MKALATLAALIPAPLLAAEFERPIPQPQTESAELSYLIASLLLLAALWAVHRLVMRR